MRLNPIYLILGMLLSAVGAHTLMAQGAPSRPRATKEIPFQPGVEGTSASNEDPFASRNLPRPEALTPGMVIEARVLGSTTLLGVLLKQHPIPHEGWRLANVTELAQRELSRSSINNTKRGEPHFESPGERRMVCERAELSLLEMLTLFSAHLRVRMSGGQEGITHVLIDCIRSAGAEPVLVKAEETGAGLRRGAEEQENPNENAAASTGTQKQSGGLTALYRRPKDKSGVSLLLQVNSDGEVAISADDFAARVSVPQPEVLKFLRDVLGACRRLGIREDQAPAEISGPHGNETLEIWLNEEQFYTSYLPDRLPKMLTSILDSWVAKWMPHGGTEIEKENPFASAKDLPSARPGLKLDADALASRELVRTLLRRTAIADHGWAALQSCYSVALALWRGAEVNFLIREADGSSWPAKQVPCGRQELSLLEEMALLGSHWKVDLSFSIGALQATFIEAEPQANEVLLRGEK